MSYWKKYPDRNSINLFLMICINHIDIRLIALRTIERGAMDREMVEGRERDIMKYNLAWLDQWSYFWEIIIYIMYYHIALWPSMESGRFK